MAKRKSKRATKSVAGVIIFIIAAIIVICTNQFADKEPDNKTAVELSNDKMYVNFIDVGQGNSTLVTCGDTAILVDGGDSAYGETVVEYLESQNVDDIDLLIATHPHSDHIGGLVEVANTYSIGDVIMPSVPKSIVPTTSTYENFLNAISDKTGSVIKAKAGSTYTYGELTVEILAPVTDYDDLNNESVVSRISYGDTSVIIMGDTETDAEEDMLATGKNFSADILNIGHHGSKTSTSEELLNAVNPQYAVICCGKDNDYGHPHKQTLTKLNEYGIEYYRTDLDGDVVFESDGKTVNKLS